MNSLFDDEEDETELFTKEEWDEILRSMKQPPLGYPTWSPKLYHCTCGAEATYGPQTTHSHWCDKIRI